MGIIQVSRSMAHKVVEDDQYSSRSKYLARLTRAAGWNRVCVLRRTEVNPSGGVFFYESCPSEYVTSTE